MTINSKIETAKNPVFPNINVKLIGESSDMRVIMTKV